MKRWQIKQVNVKVQMYVRGRAYYLCMYIVIILLQLGVYAPNRNYSSTKVLCINVIKLEWRFKRLFFIYTLGTVSVYVAWQGLG